METHCRSSYPDSPRPGDGKLSDLIAKPYSIVFIAIGLFILIFGIAILLSYRQFETTKHNALANDKTTVNLLADLILEHNKATIGILQSYANRPVFIVAVKNKDLAGVDRNLSDLKENAEIDITFVSDKRGIIWANLPVFPESRGKDFSHRDWYKGISALWKPYISTVFKQIVGNKALAVTVCVPIFDEKEMVIGILGNSQRLGFIKDAIERVPFIPYTTVNVIDRAGKILYSNKFPYHENITDYRFFPILEPALKEKKQQIDINDPQKDQEKSYLTFVPIGDIGWTVVIERLQKDIYYSDLRRFIEIGAVSFLLFLLVIFFLVYLRKAAFFRKTEALLQAETKLRQEEEKLRAMSSRQEAILATVPEIIMGVDNNKVYTWANSVGIEFFGEDVIGKEAAFYFEGEQETYDIVSPLFNGAKDIIYLESWQRRRDGQKRLLAWWCREFKDEKGRVTGAISSARDITERREMETGLKKAHEELESFAYSVSHDLRAPLRGIDGWSLALLEDYKDKLDEQGREYIDLVRSETQIMGRLIDDLLIFSRQSRAEMNQQQLDMTAMAQAIISRLQQQNPTLQADFIVQPGLRALGDASLIEIALKNLLDNAAKFSSKSSRAVIEFGQLEKEGRKAFFVRDNGVGFDMAYSKKLFGVFRRLHKTSEFPGTGIGLASVQRIINRHGGHIWAEAKVNEGATFYFILKEAI